MLGCAAWASCDLPMRPCGRTLARQLGLSPHAVDYHLRHLRRQLGVRNRTQLVLTAQAGQGGCGEGTW